MLSLHAGPALRVPAVRLRVPAACAGTRVVACAPRAARVTSPPTFRGVASLARASSPCRRVAASATKSTELRTSTDGPTDGGEPPGGGGSGGGGGGDDLPDSQPEEPEDTEPLLSASQVKALAAQAKVTVPADMLEVAAAGGLRASVVEAYLKYAAGPLKALLNASPFLRDRLLADPLLAFKLLTEMLLDASLAAYTELYKPRTPGADVLAEVEFFTTDLLVGCLLNAALVLLIATPATLGKAPGLAPGLLGAVAALPPALLGFLPKGARFSPLQRVGGALRTSVLYGAAGFTCGLVGQVTANTAAKVRRAVNPGASLAAGAPTKGGKPTVREEMPPVMRTALLWGAVTAGSASMRYQMLAGLDRAVLALPVSQRVLALPAAVTLAARFANNIVGGEHFAVHARWAGVQ